MVLFIEFLERKCGGQQGVNEIKVVVVVGNQLIFHFCAEVCARQRRQHSKRAVVFRLGQPRSMRQENIQRYFLFRIMPGVISIGSTWIA
ncbi:MAG: hypothetical protein ACE5JB_11115 [bacterium]